MKELTIEEKAKRYDEALKYAKIYYTSGDEDMKMMMKTCFPVLVEDSEDERIMKALIDGFKRYDDGSLFNGCLVREILAWLEKQGEQVSNANCLLSWSEMDEKMLKSLEGIVKDYWAKAEQEKNEIKIREASNVSYFLKTIQKSPLCWIKCSDGLPNRDGIYLVVTDGLHNEVYDMARYDSIEGWHKASEVIYWMPIPQLNNKSIIEQKPAEEYNITGIGSKHAQGKLGEMIKNLKSTDKVEPKFKIGDWIIRSAENFEHNKYLITEIKDCYVCEDLKDRRVTFTFNDVHKNFKLWDISDAKDGDVLSYRNGQWVFIFKEIENNNSIVEYYVLLSERGLEIKNAALTSLISAILPATKEQRDLLFQKMHEAGYEWDAKKKEPTKIEQKHFCKLDNSYARIKFPFKAKVKSSGKIVTIHDGQLSYDGKEWIKYQSDAKDGYKVYEPNNLLELVCEIEQNPAWSEEDKMQLDAAIHLVNSTGHIETTNWLKGLKDRVQPKQEWSEEDEDMRYKATAVINRLCAEGKEYVWSVNTLEKLFYWLKSLKDRVQPQNKWTPNEEQIEALVSAIDVMIDNRGAGDKNTILLSGLYHELKTL